jgi:hypothetical protein
VYANGDTGSTAKVAKRLRKKAGGSSAWDQANGVRLATPDKIRRLQEARGTTAKQAPTDRFSLRYDTVHRADLLA